MKRTLSVLLVGVLLLGGNALAASRRSDVAEPTRSSAADYRHEALVNGGFGTLLNVQFGQGGDGFIAAVGYLYSLCQWLQVGGSVFGGYDNAGETVGFRVLANVNFPVGGGFVDSVFVGGGAGWNDVTKPTRQFAWRGDVGLRAKIFEHVYWRPTVGPRDNGGGVFVQAELLALSFRY